MPRVKLESHEARLVKTLLNEANGDKKEAVAQFSDKFAKTWGQDKFTEIVDAILHGYEEMAFKLRLSSVVGDNYIRSRNGWACVCNENDATWFKQEDLDADKDLDKLSDGCFKEYEDRD